MDKICKNKKKSEINPELETIPEKKQIKLKYLLNPFFCG